MQFHHEVREDREESAALYPQITPIFTDFFLGSLGSMWPIFLRFFGHETAVYIHPRPTTIPNRHPENPAIPVARCLPPGPHGLFQRLWLPKC